MPLGSDSTLNELFMIKKQLDFIKMKNFWSVRHTVKRLKTQATHWEKIFEDTYPILYPKYAKVF